MTKLTDEQIKHISQLSKLPLNEKEISKYKKQLSIVLNHISELAKVDTKDLLPTSQTTGLLNVTREDECDVAISLDEKSALSGSDKTHNGYFVVSRVINEK